MTLEEFFEIIRKMNANNVYLYAGNRHYATVRSMYLRRWFDNHSSFLYDIRDIVSIDKMSDGIFQDVKVVFDMFD